MKQLRTAIVPKEEKLEAIIGSRSRLWSFYEKKEIEDIEIFLGQQHKKALNCSVMVKVGL